MINCKNTLMANDLIKKEFIFNLKTEVQKLRKFHT